MEKRQVRLAIREFVETVYLAGDLVAAGSPVAAMEGMRVHQAIQSDRGEEYSAEVSVAHTVSGKYIDLALFGRIDGLIEGLDETIIEEIKSVRHYPGKPGYEGEEVHWAQAKAYAAIYSFSHPARRLAVHLVYFEISTAETHRHVRTFTAQALAQWFQTTCDTYLRRADAEEARLIESSRLIRQMGFPFERIRAGQQEMIAAVYDHVKSSDPLYVSAPTGTGKTMGALFPAVKALADGHCRKIFYLTARNPVKAVAEESLRLLLERGFALRGVTMASKESLCAMPEGTPCDPEHCPRTVGFYDRLFPALDELPPMGLMTRRDVEALAEKHRLCPHELSLFIAEVSDVVICDYNNAFDPRVKYKRFFERGGDYLLLVDEAHNMVDRARDMFTASLSEPTLRALLDGLPLFLTDELLAVSNEAQAVLQLLTQSAESLAGQPEQETALESIPDGLEESLERLVTAMEAHFLRHGGGDDDPAFLDAYFMALFFQSVADEMDERYRILLKSLPEGLELTLRCLDPSRKLKEVLKKIRCAVFFSATLTPFAYYSRLTGTGGEASCLLLPSPFPRENLKVMAYDVDTTYARREKSLSRLVDALYAFARVRRGNYLFFFPSYQYMKQAHDLFLKKPDAPFAPMQSSGMGERDRKAFLQFFDSVHDRGMAAFAVMGGIFGEGIDLAGDRVIGVAIVGVGMPQLCLERNLIQQYHDDNDEPGYDYSYTIPGFNRVMQAVGRLIRNDTDKGVVLLADRRFGWQKYEEMMPPWWQPVELARDVGGVEEITTRFWDNN